MSFTFNRTDFVNNRSYNEQEHSAALSNGFINFIGDGLEYNGTNLITSGKGINEGVPFQIGKSGETQSITPLYNGFIVVKTTLNSLSSITEIIESPTIPNNTITIKYFAIYELNNGVVVNDLRHINYVKSLELISVPPNQFALVLNGFESTPFDSGQITDVWRLVQDFTGEAIIPNSNDLDTIKESGFYAIDAGLNLPNTISNIGVLQVINKKNNSRKMQKYTSTNDMTIYRQTTSTGNTWTNWFSESKPLLYNVFKGKSFLLTGDSIFSPVNFEDADKVHLTFSRSSGYDSTIMYTYMNKLDRSILVQRHCAIVPYGGFSTLENYETKVFNFLSNGELIGATSTLLINTALHDITIESYEFYPNIDPYNI